MLVKFTYKRYFYGPLKEIIRSGLPIFLLFISLSYYFHDKADYHLPALQASFSDPGDYRYEAEHFWRVPHRYYSYDPVFIGHWGYFLDHVPFRQIGVGTLYLLITQLFAGQGTAASQLIAAGYFLPLTLTCLLMISYLFFFTACRSVWGWKLALAAFVCLIFPPRFWAITEELLTEPFLRICSVNILTLIILLQRKRWISLKLGLIYFFLLLAAQCRAQWFFYGFFLLPFLVLFFVYQKRYWQILLSIGYACFIPFSLFLVNLWGWQYPVVTAGTGLHVNLKTNGALLDYVDEELAIKQDEDESVIVRQPVYLQNGVVDSFWGIPFPAPGQPDLPSAQELKKDYQLLDKCATTYLMADWSARIISPFLKGCLLLSNFPNGIFGNNDYRPPALFFRLLDGLTVIILAGGLCFRQSRLLASAALGFWFITIMGNIFSLYVARYLRAMAMLPFATALLVSFIIINDILVESKTFKRLAKVFLESRKQLKKGV